MELQELVKLHRNCGYKIHEVHGCYFYSRWIRGNLYPLNSSFPDNYLISIDKSLVNALKWRFLVSPVLINAQKKDRYEFVLTTDQYELEQFDRKVRNRIKKSLQTCKFIRPSLEDLLRDGLVINQQSCKRQLRKDNLLTNKKLWDKYITSIYNSREFIIWGAYFEDRLVGYLIIYELEGKFNMLQAFINRNNSSFTNPMCGLIYTAVNSLINEHGKISISYGIHRESKPSSLTSFKKHMFFEARALSSAQIVNPVFLFFVKLVVFITIKLLHRKSIKYQWLKKALYLYQGHRRLLTELHRIQKPVSQNNMFQISASSFSRATKFQSITSQ